MTNMGRCMYQYLYRPSANQKRPKAYNYIASEWHVFEYVVLDHINGHKLYGD
jgi:hypothetical protein